MMSKGLKSLLFCVVSLWSHPFMNGLFFLILTLTQNTSILNIHSLQPLDSQCIIFLVDSNTLVCVP